MLFKAFLLESVHTHFFWALATKYYRKPDSSDFDQDSLNFSYSTFTAWLGLGQQNE